MKCIFRKNPTDPHCDKEAEYIYLGKSYCGEHMELRSKQFNEEDNV